MEATIVKRDGASILALRHIGPFSGIRSAFETLSEFVKAHNVPATGTLGVFLDDPMTVV